MIRLLISVCRTNYKKKFHSGSIFGVFTSNFKKEVIRAKMVKKQVYLVFFKTSGRTDLIMMSQSCRRTSEQPIGEKINFLSSIHHDLEYLKDL